MHHGPIGKKKCLTRDKSIIVRNPFFSRDYMLEEKGLLYVVPLHILENILLCKTVY